MPQTQGIGFSRQRVEGLSQSLGYKLLPQMVGDIVIHLNNLMLEFDSVPEGLIKIDVEPSFVLPAVRE